MTEKGRFLQKENLKGKLMAVQMERHNAVTYNSARISPTAVVALSAHRYIALYQDYLERHPVLTKALTSGILAALGDATSQLVIQIGKTGPKHYQWRSTAAFAGFSMVVTGPITHYLYQFLEAVVPRKSNFSSLRKVILERLIFAPPYLLALFYTVARMEGKSHSEAWSFIKAFFLSALIKNWIVWGVAQYVNMRFVPIKYRVLFANMIALVWNFYIAIIKR